MHISRRRSSSALAAVMLFPKLADFASVFGCRLGGSLHPVTNPRPKAETRAEKRLHHAKRDLITLQREIANDPVLEAGLQTARDLEGGWDNPRLCVFIHAEPLSSCRLTGATSGSRLLPP